MKRFISCCLATMMMVTVLTACGDGNSTISPNPDVSPLISPMVSDTPDGEPSIKPEGSAPVKANDASTSKSAPRGDIGTDR